MTNRKNNLCRLCFGKIFDRVVNLRKLKIYKCRSCGLYFVPPKKNNSLQIDQYYKNFDVDKYISYYESFRKEIYRDNWKQILKLKKSGTSLDFGSSFGWFLEVAPKKWKTYGVEPADIANECRKKGYKVWQGTEGEVEKIGVKFDVVTMWNVIEHLEDPLKTVSKLSKSMSQNSIIAISFPNRNGFYNQLAYSLYFISFGYIVKPLYTLFQVDNPVPHLYHFRFRDIALLLQKAGFEVLFHTNQPIIDASKLSKRQEVERSFMAKFLAVPIIIIIDKFINLLGLNNDEIVVYANKAR